MHISCEQARRLLARYHFVPTDLRGVFARLGSVQYDPLNPIGRNPDLVLQARIPGYRIDDWQQAAYSDRLIYDAWDKQACLVPVSDWPMRAPIRQNHRPYHDEEILQEDSEGAAEVLAAIDARGPLSSLEFEDRTPAGFPGSWAGATRVKRLLRSLWACGLLVTHHRQGGRHYYDRPERVIPTRYFELEPLSDEQAYYRWIVMKRFQASGILRASGDASIWVACGDAARRRLALAQLVEVGLLTSLHIGDSKLLYHTPTSALDLLDQPPMPPRMIFLGPLDSLLWDRKAIQHIFSFDYIWEVYKPAGLRRWGYYVLPVFYGERFVARVDMRLEKNTLVIARWWWEDDITPGDALLDALRQSITRLLTYARAQDVRVLDEESGINRMLDVLYL